MGYPPYVKNDTKLDEHYSMVTIVIIIIIIIIIIIVIIITIAIMGGGTANEVMCSLVR